MACASFLNQLKFKGHLSFVRIQRSPRNPGNVTQPELYKSSTKAAPETDLTFTSVFHAFSNCFSAYLMSYSPQPVALKSLVPWDFDMYHHPLHPNSPKVLTTTLELTCVFCFKFLRESNWGNSHPGALVHKSNVRDNLCNTIPGCISTPHPGSWGLAADGKSLQKLLAGRPRGTGEKSIRDTCTFSPFQPQAL